MKPISLPSHCGHDVSNPALRAVRWAVNRSAVLVGLVGLVVMFQPVATYADTCNPPIQDESNWVCGSSFMECAAQAGGAQNITNVGPGTRWPQEATADISSYNPDYVYRASNVWSALEQNNTDAGLIAQIGWIHDTSSYSEYVYAQWTNNSGYFSGIYSFYTTPSGINNYQVNHLSNGTFELEWSNGWVLPPSSVNWGPDTVTFSGEIDAFNPTADNGDHFPGNGTTPVTVSNAAWVDQYGTGHTANLTYYAGNISGSNNGLVPIPGFAYVYHWSGSHFEMWDNRCD